MRLNAKKARNNESLDQRFSRIEINRKRNASNRNPARYSELEHVAFHYDPQTDYQHHIAISIGTMDIVCNFCFALKYKAEPPRLCCNNGKVKIHQRAPPHELLSYMNGESEESRHFLQNTRKYNSCFAMTSFGATAIIGESGFRPTFKIQGQVYHRIGSLLPEPDEAHKFLQIYFMNNEEQIEWRCQIILDTRQNIVQNLQRLLNQYNSLIQSFKTAIEYTQLEEYKLVIRADKRPIGEHERR